MWKQLKALAEPLERVMTTLGVKGSKPNAASGTSQFSIFTKQQVTTVPSVNLHNSVKVQKQASLRDFIFEKFTILNSFTPLPAPVPVTFSQTPLRICKPQRIGLTANYAFLQPAGTRNVFYNSGARNFSSVQTTVFNNSSGVIAKLGYKPFSALATKTGALWARSPNNLGHNANSNSSEIVGLKIEAGRKLFQSKGIFDAVQKQESDEHKHNKPRVIRRTNIKKSSRKNKTVTKTIDQEIADNDNDVQVYISFILGSSLFWDYDESSISLESSHSSINSIASVVSHLMRKRNVHKMNTLDPLFIENLQKHAELQYDHMMEVISILKILQTHEGYEIKIFDCELRVNFPRGMTIIEVENLLQRLGIDPDSPHFELEVINFGGNIAVSPLNDEIDVHLPEPIHNFQFYEEDDPFLFVRDSHLSISPASPSHIPSPGTMSFISAPPSPCMSPWKSVPQSPKHGQEYVSGIEEFITYIDDKGVDFGTRRDNSEIDESEIGESYFAL